MNWGECEFTYATLFAQSRAVAAELTGKFGVKPGDRVALWVKNCPEFVSALFGIWSAGGVVVPINNFFKPAEVGYIVKDSGANVLITDAELAAQGDTLKDRPSEGRDAHARQFSAQCGELCGGARGARG